MFHDFRPLISSRALQLLNIESILFRLEISQKSSDETSESSLHPLNILSIEVTLDTSHDFKAEISFKLLHPSKRLSIPVIFDTSHDFNAETSSMELQLANTTRRLVRCFISFKFHAERGEMSFNELQPRNIAVIFSRLGICHCESPFIFSSEEQKSNMYEASSRFMRFHRPNAVISFILLQSEKK